MRKSIGGWRNTDINGKPLRIDNLSTKLTKVQFYKRTICGVEADDYLLRRINGVEEPLVAKSNQARDALLDVLTQAITSLQWKDFETLTDVVFARSGWHRASAIGGNQCRHPPGLRLAAPPLIGRPLSPWCAYFFCQGEILGLVPHDCTRLARFRICAHVR